MLIVYYAYRMFIVYRLPWYPFGSSVVNVLEENIKSIKINTWVAKILVEQ